MDGSQVLAVLAALLAAGAIAVGIYLWIRAARKTWQQRQAQIAIEADELDLDKRLGRIQFTKIEIKTKTGAVPVDVAWRQIGEGPDIICIHGIGASSLIYRRLAPLLSADYRVTCIDLPGFGASEKPRTLDYGLDQQAQALATLIREGPFRKPLVIASSMGGAISLWAARQNPEMLRGLVVCSPAVEPKRVPSLLMPVTVFGEKLHAINTPTMVKAVVNQVIARKELITPMLVRKYHEPFSDDGASSAAFLKAVKLLADRRIPTLFQGLTTPLLIVRGLRDRLVTQNGCEKLRQLIPDAKFVTHPDASHHVMEDEPNWTADQVRNFDTTLR